MTCDTEKTGRISSPSLHGTLGAGLVSAEQFLSRFWSANVRMLCQIAEWAWSWRQVMLFPRSLVRSVNLVPCLALSPARVIPCASADPLAKVRSRLWMNRGRSQPRRSFWSGLRHWTSPSSPEGVPVNRLASFRIVGRSRAADCKNQPLPCCPLSKMNRRQSLPRFLHWEGIALARRD
jgi:hypothetical protein